MAGLLCTIFIRATPRSRLASEVSASAGNPYRGGALWRLHATSTLLVIPQFAVSVLGTAYPVSGKGFTPTSAGFIMGFAQLAGAVGRLAAGR